MLGICTVQTARSSVCCITDTVWVSRASCAITITGKSGRLVCFWPIQILNSNLPNSLRRSIIALHVAAVGRYVDEKGGSGVVG